MKIYLNIIEYKNYLSHKDKFNLKKLNEKNIPERKEDKENRHWYILLREDKNQIIELKYKFNNIVNLILNISELIVGTKFKLI